MFGDELLDRQPPGANQVTNTHMVPTQFHRLLGLDDDVRAATDISTMRYVVHGAAPCPPEEKRRMIEWWGPVVHEYYGTTEGGGTIVGPEDWLAHPGTVGRPWPGAEIRILDDDTHDVAAGTVGTVYIKLAEDGGFEYYTDDAKTAASRIPGWFTVGDIGHLDSDGYLYLHDRSANLTISGGVNIYPAEIEGALLLHPAVGDVAVFGIPDDEFGERVHAVVEPVAGVVGDDALIADLTAHGRVRLAGFKVPRYGRSPTPCHATPAASCSSECSATPTGRHRLSEPRSVGSSIRTGAADSARAPAAPHRPPRRPAPR